MSLIQLPYLKVLGQESKTPTGFTEITETNGYVGISIRNNYIFKVDIIKYLCNIFSDTTTNTDRNIIYLILSGKAYSAGLHEEIADMFKRLCEKDCTFMLFLSKCMSYQINDKYYNNMSLFNIFLKFTYADISNVRKFILRNVPYRKYLFESHLYMYFSINRDIDVNSLSEIKGLEVLTV